ncbi:MAG: hypothetical protein Tsb005_20040 [Gammaproteobacteria bacterium]
MAAPTLEKNNKPSFSLLNPLRRLVRDQVYASSNIRDNDYFGIPQYASKLKAWREFYVTSLLRDQGANFSDPDATRQPFIIEDYIEKTAYDNNKTLAANIKAITVDWQSELDHFAQQQGVQSGLNDSLSRASFNDFKQNLTELLENPDNANLRFKINPYDVKTRDGSQLDATLIDFERVVSKQTVKQTGPLKQRPKAQDVKETVTTPEEYTVLFLGNAQLYEQPEAFSRAIRLAVENNTKVLLFNYRGIFDSQGEALTFQDFVNDGIDVVKQLVDQGAKVHLDGFSFGGTVANSVGHYFHTSSEYKDKSPEQLPSVMIRASFDNLDEVIRGFIDNFLRESNNTLLRGAGYVLRPLGRALFAFPVKQLMHAAGYDIKDLARKHLEIPETNRDYYNLRAKDPNASGNREPDQIIRYSASLANGILNELHQQRNELIQQAAKSPNYAPIGRHIHDIEVKIDKVSNQLFDHVNVRKDGSFKDGHLSDPEYLVSLNNRNLTAQNYAQQAHARMSPAHQQARVNHIAESITSNAGPTAEETSHALVNNRNRRGLVRQKQPQTNLAEIYQQSLAERKNVENSAQTATHNTEQSTNTNIQNPVPTRAALRRGDARYGRKNLLAETEITTEQKTATTSQASSTQETPKTPSNIEYLSAGSHLENSVLIKLLSQAHQTTGDAASLQLSAEQVNVLNATSFKVVSTRDLHKIIKTQTGIELDSEQLHAVKQVNQALYIQRKIINPVLLAYLTAGTYPHGDNTKLIKVNWNKSGVEQHITALNKTVFSLTDDAKIIKHLQALTGLDKAQIPQAIIDNIQTENTRIHHNLINDKYEDPGILVRAFQFGQEHKYFVATLTAFTTVALFKPIVAVGILGAALGTIAAGFNLTKKLPSFFKNKHEMAEQHKQAALEKKQQQDNDWDPNNAPTEIIELEDSDAEVTQDTEYESDVDSGPKPGKF